MQLIPMYRLVGQNAWKTLLGESIAGYRSSIWLFLAFAGQALVLAAIGLYGLMAYSVAQRIYEISVRMAIGARASGVVKMVFSQSLRITLTGIASGALISFFALNVVSSMLFNVKALDPVVYATVMVTVLLVAIAASSIPAFRAARIDPIRTLRAE